METLLAILGTILAIFGLVRAVRRGLAVDRRRCTCCSGSGLLVYAGVRSAGRLTELVGSSTARGGANVLVQTAILIGICGALAWLSMRHPVHWDWTESQAHSLTQGTVDVLDGDPRGRPRRDLRLLHARRGAAGQAGARQVRVRRARA